MTLEEQLYLLERSRRMKELHTQARDVVKGPPLTEITDADISEKVDQEDMTVYLVFMEGSTRTRESLRNAAVYHGVKVNEFQAETSSFQKNETITDTMKMLSVYSTDRSVFVIRSPLEGVCSWLQTALPAHAERYGIPRPAFLNAGDGRYSHPLNEYVDMFTLLEQLKWDRSAIHIALVGDLAHGRTAHSKVDGLKVFHKVKVDLIAPELIEYQVEYKNRMYASGFEVREFSSIEEYLERAAGSLATIWYFYQPQFSKCGEITEETKREAGLKVTFRPEWQTKLEPGTCFFQTLPRDKDYPIIPIMLDDSPLNGWAKHANNAYFVHVILLGMLFGKIGFGLSTRPPKVSSNSHIADPPMPAWSPTAKVDLLGSEVPRCPFSAKDSHQPLPGWIEVVDLKAQDRSRRPERASPGGAVPVTDGLIIDHIGKHRDANFTWKRLRMARNVLDWGKHAGSEGVFESSIKTPGMHKGVLALPDMDFETVTVQDLKALASISPGCTVNAVQNSRVVAKYRLHVPERIYNLPNIRCRNSRCVSFPINKQRDVVPYFERVAYYETSILPKGHTAEFLFVCKYCRWPHQYENIWSDLGGKSLQEIYTPVTPTL